MGKSTIAKKRYSFRKAYEKIPIYLAKEARRRLSDAMGINSINTWTVYKNQGFNPRLDVYLAVNRIFNEYGITDAWEEIEV